MMFSHWKSFTTTCTLFKWFSQGKNPELLMQPGDAYHEVEMSNYFESRSSDHPSSFLNGRSPEIDQIADLDIFLEKLYKYHCQKGIWCIIVKWIVELLSLCFTIVFSAFFLLFVDWHGLHNAKCGIDADELATKPCDMVKRGLQNHPLVPFTFTKAIIIGYLAILTIFFLFCFLTFFVHLEDLLETRHFYNNRLNVTDCDLQTTTWPEILKKIVHVQSSRQFCAVKYLSCHEVVMRIMRKENYLIGMINMGILSFPIPSWIPGAGPAIKSGSYKKKNHLFMTNTFEWMLNWCILQFMFDRNSRISNFISNPSSLRKRFLAVGIGMLLLSPCLIISVLVYFFLRHARQFYNHPSIALSRRWSNVSRWIFREFNEMDHLFKHRMDTGAVHASDYLKQFPSPIISLVAKFISFASGGLTVVLMIIAFLEESLLEGHLFDHNLLWYAAIFGTMTVISRAVATDDLMIFDPKEAMSLVVLHTHYMPKRWLDRENINSVRSEFKILFQCTAKMLLDEMVSIFLTPYLLLFVLPKHVDDILQFISNFTVDVEGVGHVCSFSTFNFKFHGNSKYASPFNAPQDRRRRSSQGKMEKSFLSFQNAYPWWEPNSQGHQFVSNLGNFVKKHANQKVARHGCSSPMQPTKPNSGSFWMENPQRTHPYLLDWYYTTQVNDNRRCATPSLEAPAAAIGDYWSTDDNNRVTRKEKEDHWICPPAERVESNFSHDNTIPHLTDLGDPEDSTESNWWVRFRGNSTGSQISFPEPPTLLGTNLPCRSSGISSEICEDNYDDDGSMTDLGKSHMLSSTTCLDGCNEDLDFRLPFEDIYVGPSQNLPFKHQPPFKDHIL